MVAFAFRQSIHGVVDFAGVSDWRRAHRSHPVDVLARPAGSPSHSTPFDPVVRLAWEAPVSNGWRQRHGLAVEGHRPGSRAQGGDNLKPAATRTQMHDRGVAQGDVEDSRLEAIRNVLDKFVPEGFNSRQPRPRSSPCSRRSHRHRSARGHGRHRSRTTSSIGRPPTQH